MKNCLFVPPLPIGVVASPSIPMTSGTPAAKGKPRQVTSPKRVLPKDSPTQLEGVKPQCKREHEKSVEGTAQLHEIASPQRKRHKPDDEAADTQETASEIAQPAILTPLHLKESEQAAKTPQNVSVDIIGGMKLAMNQSGTLARESDVEAESSAKKDVVEDVVEIDVEAKSSAQKDVVEVVKLQPNATCTKIAEELQRTKVFASRVPDMTMKKASAKPPIEAAQADTIEQDGLSASTSTSNSTGANDKFSLAKPAEVRKVRPSLTKRLDSALLPSPAKRRKTATVSDEASDGLISTADNASGAPNLRLDRQAAHRMITHYASNRKVQMEGESNGIPEPKKLLAPRRRKVLGQAPRALLAALVGNKPRITKASSSNGCEQRAKVVEARISPRRNKEITTSAREDSAKDKEAAEQAAKQALAMLRARRPQSGPTMLQVACQNAAHNVDKQRGSISGTAAKTIKADLSYLTAQSRKAGAKLQARQPGQTTKRRAPREGVIEVLLSDSDTETFED